MAFAHYHDCHYASSCLVPEHSGRPSGLKCSTHATHTRKTWSARSDHAPNNMLTHTMTSHHLHAPLFTDPEMYTLRSMFLNQSSPQEMVNKCAQPHRFAYVEALVDTNVHVIETLWSPITVYHGKSAVVPLRTFIQEVLKRSRTTYSTLQTALFYLFRAQPAILGQHCSNRGSGAQHGNPCWREAYIGCGRRMFLASLVVASKFVQDKTYRNSAWAKIAGLPVAEINAAERIFLELIDYQLYISQSTFHQWHHLLFMHVDARAHNRPGFFLHDLARLTSLKPTHAQDATPAQPCFSHTLSNPPHRKRRLWDTSSPNEQRSTAWLAATSPQSTSPGSLTWTGDAASTNSIASNGSSGSLPVLSISLPSSNSSSPMRTPTQVSPVRIQDGPMFVWKTGLSPAHPSGVLEAEHDMANHQHDSQHFKRRRVTTAPMIHCNHSYAISHVRSMRQEQCSIVP